MGTHLRSLHQHGRDGSDAAQGRHHLEKKRFRPWEVLRQEVQEFRRRYLSIVRSIAWERLVFLDETGVHRAMARSHGWGPRGEAVIDYRPHSRGENFTVIGAITHDRVLSHETFRGGLNTPRWRTYVTTKLLPRLKPGDVLVMDNLRIHHDPYILQRLDEHGVRVLFLPPYSPDFNPIEPVWALMKAHLRTLAERDPLALPRTVWRALLTVTQRQIRAMFQHCISAQVN